MTQEQAKNLGYATGAIKRKLGIPKGSQVEPGELIRKAREARSIASMPPKKRTAFLGLV